MLTASRCSDSTRLTGSVIFYVCFVLSMPGLEGIDRLSFALEDGSWAEVMLRHLFAWWTG